MVEVQVQHITRRQVSSVNCSEGHSTLTVHDGLNLIDGGEDQRASAGLGIEAAEAAAPESRGRQNLLQGVAVLALALIERAIVLQGDAHLSR